MRRTTLALLAATVFASHALAGLIPGAITVTPDGGNFRYSYDIHLPSDYKIKGGDFFTIYDFHGMVAGGPVAQPAGWHFSNWLTGPNPPGILPTDDPTVDNLAWRYEGPDIIGGGSLGLFEAVSMFGPNTSSTAFASMDHRAIDDHAVGNITSTLAPDPGQIPEAPEPASFALLAVGLSVVGLARLRRQKLHAA